MKPILIAVLLAMIACGNSEPVFGQFAPVQLVEVKPVNTKKDATSGYGNQSAYTQSRVLRITIRNATAQAMTGVKVRWGIVKERLPSGSALIKPYTAAFGGDEIVDLKPSESKTIETASVDAHGTRWNYLPPSGEKIVGHGVQILVADKVVVEEITPPGCKKTFEKVYPPGVDPTSPGWLQRLQGRPRQ